jgi:hypothetical protein
VSLSLRAVGRLIIRSDRAVGASLNRATIVPIHQAVTATPIQHDAEVSPPGEVLSAEAWVLAELAKAQPQTDVEIDDTLTRPSTFAERGELERFYAMRRLRLHRRLVGADGTGPEPEREHERLARVLELAPPPE